jgi:hypothetical protein
MKNLLDDKRIQQLRKIKLWANDNAPGPAKGAVNYALGWLSPEWLGSGVKFEEALRGDEPHLLARIPRQLSNCNPHGEIHQGLVTNVCLEMTERVLSAYLGEGSFSIQETYFSLSKKLFWTDDITARLQMDTAELEKLSNKMAKGEKGSLEFKVFIKVGGRKSVDFGIVKLDVKRNMLLP